MKCVLQRVSRASVTIDGEKISEIGHGLLILVCIVEGDTRADIEKMAGKCSRLRIFDDDSGVMNRSVSDVGGEVLAVSQFTLAANVRKGNRPSYIAAAGHDTAIPGYEEFCRLMEEAVGKPVKRGRFGADMQVELVNDGPVTIIIDTKDLV